MKKTALLSILVYVLAGAFAHAQGNESVTNADVVRVLEEINQKIDRKTPAPEKKSENVAFQFSIGPELRYLPAIDSLNANFASQGSFGAMSPIIIPFLQSFDVSGGIVVNNRYQFEMGFQSFGAESTGFLKHRTGAGADTVDTDGDGLDDYYSTAWYSSSTFNVGGKILLVDSDLFGLSVGARAGLGSDRLGIDRTPRNVLSSVLAVLTGNSGWKRCIANLGGSIGIRVWEIGFTVGFDYHLPIGNWIPSTGVHKSETVPSENYNTMNVYVEFDIGGFNRQKANRAARVAFGGSVSTDGDADETES